MIKANISINNKTFSILVAETDAEKERGLMFKKPPIQPMAFYYGHPNYLRFWMKNTIAPLDIIFCFKNKIVSIKHGIPLDETPIGPDLLTDLVLEFNKGFVEEHDIKVGDIITLS